MQQQTTVEGRRRPSTDWQTPSSALRLFAVPRGGHIGGGRHSEGEGLHEADSVGVTGSAGAARQPYRNSSRQWEVSSLPTGSTLRRAKRGTRLLTGPLDLHLSYLLSL